ncbi:transporter substrate-binding domain-containing protein [Pseudoalteromonas luteoviolacea]|uniref:substrate-binding periplasmic protein n=1 Tax=Pseudoalteromonas luteoviolacea TaxID=43657 RepID=UPI001B36C0E0|nr:transporter substrate-binding domain-containing protein [Pseudoalteromonas luteoviolacea]
MSLKIINMIGNGARKTKRAFNSLYILMWGVFSIIMSGLVHAKTLRIVTLEYPPYQYLENNVPKGIGVEIVTEVFKRLKQPIDIQFLPWGRAIRELQSGHADGIFTIYFSKDRQQTMLYSDQVLIMQSVSIFTRKDTDIKLVGNIRELGEVRVGLVRNVSYGTEIDAAIKSGVIDQLVETNSGTQSFKLLLADRVDVVISNKLGGMNIVQRLGLQNTVVPNPLYELSIPSYFAFSKNAQGEKLKAQFDKTLQAIKADGTYDAILQLSRNCRAATCFEVGE